MVGDVEKWDLFEASFKGPSSNNPYLDVTLDVEFAFAERRVGRAGILRWRRHVPRPLHAEYGRRLEL